MKQYDVYVMGDALVDFEYKIPESMLSQLALQKGVRTLIDDAQQQHVLLTALAHREGIKACGGSAANTACAIAAFGGRVFLSTKVANDTLGHFYLAHLQQLGITSNLTHDNLEPGVTGTCISVITPDAERSMRTFLGISASLSTNDINAHALQQAHYLYLEGYSATSASTLTAALTARDLAKKHPVKIALTFSDPTLVLQHKPALHTLLENGVDLLFCNLREAQLFSETTDINAIKNNLKKYAHAFVITRGAQGCLIFDGTTFIELAGEKITAVDSHGAGDMFAGAFLSALTRQQSFHQAGEFANHAAARIVQKFGPQLTREEAQALRQNV